MKKLALVFLAGFCLVGKFDLVNAGEKPLNLRRIFAHPHLQGTLPDRTTFSPDGGKIAFLWNQGGERFRDLYFTTIPRGKLIRLTELAGLPENERADDQRTRDEIQEANELNRGISSAVWSRDSKWILFAYRGDFFKIEARAGAKPLRLLHTATTERSPSFSPDGAWLAYTRDNDIFLMNTADGRQWQVTRGGSSELRNGTGYYDSFIDGIFWSDDAGKIAFVQYDLAELTNLVIPDYVRKKVTTTDQQREIAGGKLALTRVGVVELDSLYKKPRWLPLPDDQEFYLRSLDWSPDNQHLLLEIMQKNQKEHYLIQCAMGDSVCDTLWRDTDTCWVPSFSAQARYGPEGKTIIFGSEKSGWRHLYQLPTTGSPTDPQALTKGEWPVEHWQLSRDRKTILYDAGDGGPAERHLHTIDLTNGKSTTLSTKPGMIRSQTISERGDVAAYVFGDLSHPYDLYWLPTNGKQQPIRLTRSPLADFADYNWREPEFLQIPTDDGKIIHAKMYQPDDFDPTVKYPLVVYTHGAGYAQSVHKAPWRYSDLFNRVLAQEGYVVLEVDYRGSKGYGRGWRTDVYRYTGGKDLEDHITGVKYLTERGFIDSTRVGIWGWSYGGFMTNMAMFKAPEVFKVGCSVAAVNDWENYNLWYTTARFNYPENDSLAFHRSSPIHFAAGLQGKLLLIHGMKDSNVHFQDTVQLIDKLIKLGKDFDVMVYPRENHGFTRDESNVHVFAKILAYFNAHL